MTLGVVIHCKLLFVIETSGRESLYSIGQEVTGRREADRQCSKEEQKLKDV